jgi:hypothetical protein
MSDATTQTSGNTSATAGAQPGAGATATGAGAAAPAPAPAAAAAPTSQQASAGQPAAPAAATTQGAGKPGGEAGKPATPPAAPDKYEFKAPQGVTLDADTITAYSEVAKELGLPQDAAQKVIDKLAPKLAAQNARALSQAIQSTSTEWAKATQTDPEIGGEKFGENLAVAKRGLERFASPELRSLLGPYHPQKNPKGTGLGNHPELVRLFFKVGKGISEDTVPPGGRAPTNGDRDAATVLYGNKSSKS